LTSAEVVQLPELAQGEGLWRVKERAFVVRHLLTAAELALFDTNSRMLGKGDGFPGIPTVSGGT
jgi:hypothetical protein